MTLYALRKPETVGEWYRSKGEMVEEEVFTCVPQISVYTPKRKGDDETADVTFNTPYTMLYEGHWTNDLNCKPYKVKEFLSKLIEITEKMHGYCRVEFSDTGRMIEFEDRGKVTEGYRVKIKDCQFFPEFLGFKGIKFE